MAGQATERVAPDPEPGRVTGMLKQLTGQHGPLMFHQSGGCCDGSSPMRFPDGEFLTGDSDILLGKGSGFSVEAPEGVRFLIRSRLLTEAETDHFQLS